MLELTLSGKKISTDKAAFVMGILNATNDSFYSGSKASLELALKFIEEGADIIDIGGESTRPGYSAVSEDEEINRILPIIIEIRKRSDILISVDTSKKAVMQAAWEMGANILNDVSALSADKTMAKFAAEKELSVILTHRFTPTEGLKDPEKNIVENVSDYLDQRIEYGIKEGIKKSNFIIDPGIGFGKDYEENLALICASKFLCKGDFPVLMALSRKRCISQMINNGILKDDIEDRLPATITANILAIQFGAKIIRVHDVKAASDSLNVIKNLMKKLI